MWRSNSKRDMLAWTAILCFLAFGAGMILVKRFRPAGPVEFHELPASSVPVISPRATVPTIPVAPPTSPPTQTQTQTPTETTTAPTGPNQAASNAAPRSKSKAEPEAQSISINSGDLSELEKLPGVGPGLAQKIIDYRNQNGPFQSVDDLRNVKGIGEKRLAKITPYVRL